MKPKTEKRRVPVKKGERTGLKILIEEESPNFFKNNKSVFILK